MKTPERPLGLYIHIPFCKQKCAYCDFYSLAGNESRMDAYTDALCADLTEQSQYVGAYRVDTVYFGGDCDTVAAIAGSIAEGFYGIPEDLKQQCRNRLPANLRKVLNIFEKQLNSQV